VLNACACFLGARYRFTTRISTSEYSDFFPGDDDIICKKTLAAKRSVLPMIPRAKVKMLPCNPATSRARHYWMSAAMSGRSEYRLDYGDNRIATLIIWEVQSDYAINRG
jgi:hypothetical protein